MRLRQTLAPAPNASWTEYTYTGEVKVSNGEVETDNQTIIEVLLSRGFTPVQDAEQEAEVVADDAPEPSKPAPSSTDEKGEA